MADDDFFREHIIPYQQLQTSLARWAIWINIPFAALYVMLGSFNFLPHFTTAYGFHIIYMYLSSIVIATAAMMWELWWNPFALHAKLAHGPVSEQRQAEMLEENRERVRRNFRRVRGWVGCWQRRGGRSD